MAKGRIGRMRLVTEIAEKKLLGVCLLAKSFKRKNQNWENGKKDDLGEKFCYRILKRKITIGKKDELGER